MASNLVTDIIRLATPAVIDALAQALGLKADVARKALAAAVPAVIGMLVNKSGTPMGARDIFAALAKASPDAVGGLDAGGAAGFAKAGSGVLGSLFGESTASVVSNVVGKYAGLDGKAGGALMGAATQMILGGLAREKSAGGLDASGLAHLLNAQKNNVAEGLPAGLGALLAAAPGLASSFSGFAEAAPVSTAAAREAMQSANRMATNAAAGSGSRWAMWLAALVVIGGGAWYFLQSKPTAPVETGTTTTQPATTDQGATTTQPTTTDQGATTTPPAAPSLVVDGVDVGKAAVDALGGFVSALGAVSDAASAQAAAGKLQEGQGVIDGLIAQAAKLTPEQKAAFASLLAPALSSLQAAVGKAMAVPGAGDVLKPAVEQLMAKVVLLAR